MRITVLGAGNVGRTLGARLSKIGHDITFTARDLDSEKIKACLAGAADTADAKPPSQAALDSEAVILATQYGDAAPALEGLGDITGKIVIDTTNPLEPDLSGLSFGHQTSAAEELQAAFPGTKTVKCFNTTGFNIMEKPPRGAVMLAAGDDAQAKSAVLGLARELGFEAVDAGPLSQARLLEPLAMLWISMAYRQGLGRDYAFSIIRSS